MISTAQKCKVLFLAEELRVGGAETYFYRLEAGIDRRLSISIRWLSHLMPLIDLRILNTF